jgi:hypothetical protein
MPDFATSIDRLLTQVRHWEQPRWSAPVPSRPASAREPGPESGPQPGPGPAREPGPGFAREPGQVSAPATRGDRAFELVQTLADLGANAERRPRRPVPREHDMILPDQLRVLADDLLTAAPPAALLESAEAAVEALRDTL